MKKYKTELTETQLQKLTMFIAMYENKLLETSEVYQKESIRDNDYTLETRRIFTSNAVWYRETYDIIHELKEYLNEIPF